MAKKEPGNWHPVDTIVRDRLLDTPPPFKGTSSSYTILAIDPGTKNLAACFIHRTPQRQIVSTTKFLSPKFDTTFQKITYLYEMIQRWVDYQIDFNVGVSVLKLDALIKESIAHGYAGGVADAGRVQHMLELLAYNRHIPFVDVNPSAMRAYMGSASKSDTKLAVYKKFHLEFDSEDECDVFAIAMTGLALMSGEYVPKTKKK